MTKIPAENYASPGILTRLSALSARNVRDKWSLA